MHVGEVVELKYIGQALGQFRNNKNNIRGLLIFERGHNGKYVCMGKGSC